MELVELTDKDKKLIARALMKIYINNPEARDDDRRDACDLKLRLVRWWVP